MPNLTWSDLSPLQLGRCAEYWAQLEFLSYRYEIYPAEVDDHGVDFLAKSPAGALFEVQVKSSRSNYVYITKAKMPRLEPSRLVCYLRFRDGVQPDIYIIPAAAWKQPNELLVSRDYGTGRRSRPEWGISCSKRHQALLERYRAEQYFIDQNKQGA